MSASPPATPTRHGLFARLCDHVRAIRPWVRWTLAGLVVLVVVGVCGGGAVALRKLDERQKASAAVEQWSRFDKAARSGDEPEMLAALDAITPLTADPLCDLYRETITSGVAPSDDPKLCLLTTTLHARRGRWTDASREAAKRLVHEPGDWLSRCVVALAAVSAGDPKAAGEQLDRLPDPARAAPTPAGLLLAFELFRRCDRDTTPLRRFVNEVVVDVLNSVGVADDPPPVKVELVECYLLGFSGPPDEPLPARMGTAVAAVVRLADDAATADEPVVLTRLGTACNRLAVAVERLHQAKQITVEQRDGLTKEHDARTAQVWRRVRGLAPKTPQAYHGLAVLEVRAKRLEKAMDEVRTGLAACGNDPTLLALYTVLLRATDRTDDALRTLAKAADEDPTNLNLLLLVAETALEVPRRDVADIALRRAAGIAPTDPRVIRNDVRLRLIQGDAHGAVQRLRDLGEPTVLADPLLARVYTRSLTEAGLHVLLPDWLDRAERYASGANKPAVAAATVRGVCDARFDPDTAKLALTVIDRTLARWPGDPDALVARGLLLTRLAEFGTPRWEPARTRDAAFALERLRAIVPDDPDAAALLARTRLKGLNDASKAVKDIAPLLAVRDRGGLLAPAHLAVVGMVLLANDKPDTAQAVLEEARKFGPSAAVCIHLALAYHTRGDTARGRELVAEARRMPRTPQDDADLLALPAPLRENP